eukprot:199876-Amphidinium_carterae.1
MGPRQRRTSREGSLRPKLGSSLGLTLALQGSSLRECPLELLWMSLDCQRPAREGLGEPAPRAGEEADAEAQAEVPPPEGGLPEAPPDPEGLPATDEPLALPTDTLREFQDAEEGERLEESPPLHSETRLPREIKEDGS